MSATVRIALEPPSRVVSAATDRPQGTVFLPKEHGSWSLVLEPLALGLFLAPSWAGGALAGVALAGFFSRRPLKASVDPLPSRRRATARRTFSLWTGLAGLGLIEMVVLGGPGVLGLLIPVGAGGLVFATFDLQGESRAAGAELAGCATFALLPAVLGALAGWPTPAALALAGVSLARSIPAVLTVRTFLRVAKGVVVRPMIPLLASGMGFAALTGLALAGLVPALAGVMGALLFVRTGWLVGPWRPAWRARRIGQMEAGLGLLYALVIAASWTHA